MFMPPLSPCAGPPSEGSGNPVPNYWILKTDADTYPFDQLQRERRTTWDGVTNALALKHIRGMVKGDRALIYHSGDEKALVGLATIASAPYPDPKAGDPKVVVVDVQAGKRLARPVTLAAVKADPAFADLGLVRMSRLSVIPVPPTLWKKLLAMAGEPG
jgi:predicted RNA-binding protein with PUA-like domain